MSDLVAALTLSAERFAAAARACPTADWLRRPAPDVWSVAQVVDHVCRVERAVGAAIAAAAVVTERPTDAVGKDAAVIRAQVLDRTNRPAAPERMLPPEVPASADELVPQFEAAHAALITLATTLHDTLPHRYVPHFRFGNLDGAQWLALLAAHAERHAEQIDEILATLAAA